jgi:hypothetical protein
MIVGNGMFAKSLTKIDSDEIIFFVSGVSNSKEIDIFSFIREKNLLLKTIEETNNEKILIYFSSVLSSNGGNEYYVHKKNMEELICKISKRYIIFKVPQILGDGGNKNNLINYLKTCILDEKEISICKNTKRSIIDIDDLVFIVNNIIKKYKQNQIYFISHIEKLFVFEIVHIIGKILNKIPKIEIVNCEYSNWDSENSDIIKKEISKIEEKGYTEKTLRKRLA